MMTVTLTCPECTSAIEIYPSIEAEKAECPICQYCVETHFLQEHEESRLTVCPCCQRKDFYKQKDFNRKIGALLFVIAAILSIFTYGLSFVVLYLFDLLLFKKLKYIVICYKCQTVFRQVKGIENFHGFDHEMNDRIVYSDHDFEGKAPVHD